MAVSMVNTCYMLSDGISSAPLIAFGLLFAATMYVPELVERPLNRRVIIPRELLDELSRAATTKAPDGENTGEPHRDDCTEV